MGKTPALTINNNTTMKITKINDEKKYYKAKLKLSKYFLYLCKTNIKNLINIEIEINPRLSD